MFNSGLGKPEFKPKPQTLTIELSARHCESSQCTFVLWRAKPSVPAGVSGEKILLVDPSVRGKGGGGVGGNRRSKYE